MLASLALLPLFLFFIGIALERAFVNSLHSAEKEALMAHIYALIGVAEADNHQLNLPEILTEPRFSTPNSGLYAFVQETNKDVVWRSQSLSLIRDAYLVNPANFEAGQAKISEMMLLNEKHFIFSFDTIWDINNKDKNFRFNVVHSQKSMQQETHAYRRTLTIWLGGMAFLLFITQFIIAGWGLIPLRKLALELRAFQQGKVDQLTGNYPTEIRPVTDNLNQVLNSEKLQREKYKNTLSDLAHSLKTPLAVIRSHMENAQKTIGATLTSSNITNEAIDEQINRMSEIINHQLRRATMTSTHIHHSNANLKQLASRLSHALNKVYADKQIHLIESIPDHINILCDESDMMELLGNIIENAFKYCNKAVTICADTDDTIAKISIEDDGEGIPEGTSKNILSRGARADTATPGQGIGLSVSIDIISSYGGSLNIAQSALGGAAFVISLPLKP